MNLFHFFLCNTLHLYRASKRTKRFTYIVLPATLEGTPKKSYYPPIANGGGGG